MKYTKLLLLTLFSLGLMLITNASYEASEVDNTINNCMATYLSADQQSVGAGHEIKFTLEYQSVDPVCSPLEMENASYTVDFSSLVGDDGSIDASFDTKLFEVNIANNGIVTITFKDWDDVHNTLDSFSGSFVFTIKVSNDVRDDVTITDNADSNITINVTPPSTDTSNTSKWADESYVDIGDLVNYNVRINTDQNEVTNFTGTDTPASGLKYIDDSIYVTNLATGETVDPSMYTVTEEDNNLIFTNTQPFNEAYVIHYQMQVVAFSQEYANSFEAVYDNLTEGDDWTVSFDTSGEGNANFTNGRIDILKTDLNGTPLEGAEFDIINSNNDAVEHVVTGSDGHGLTTRLALGNYQVQETKAPIGYKLDSTLYPVEISSDDGTNAQITITNEPINLPDISLPDVSYTGSIEITKESTDGKILSGAEFNIINSDDEVVDHVTTNNSGVGITQQLPLGDYNIVETLAPDGYQLDPTPHLVTIKSNNQLVQITITNEKVDNSFGGGSEIEEITSQIEGTDQDSKIIDSNIHDTDSKRSLQPTNVETNSLAQTGSNTYLMIIGLTVFCFIIILIKKALTITK